ncbi:MAG: InlB B-repeat-containing protein [Lachnospiraceae bacterium]|nr:InlB B-repeat-containing protein [Lachnospiraceae bacterium]
MRFSVRTIGITCILTCMLFLTACTGQKRTAVTEAAVTGDVTPEVTVTSEVKAEKATYSVRFTGTGGSNYPDKAEKMEDEAFVIPADIPVRRSYVFNGWYTADDPEKMYKPGDSYTENRDTEFRSSWKLAETSDDPELGANKISLSGKRNDTLVTDKYYYYEGEKFFVYFDKDLKIPGDFCDNISLIIDRLEKETGLDFICPNPVNRITADDTIFAKKDPWRDFQVGNKLVIYVLADRDALGLIPCADTGGRYIYVVEYELFSDDLWNSVPEYRDNPWRLCDYIRYDEIAHELSHALTNRYHAATTYVISEGSAEYYSERAIRALQNVSEDFKKSYGYVTEFKETKIAKKITPDTAEDIFLADFEDVDFADRGDEYIFGRMLLEFLTERYGKTFLKDFLNGASERELKSVYSSPAAHETDRHAQLIKDLAGEDVFREFGEWYQSGKYSK